MQEITSKELEKLVDEGHALLMRPQEELYAALGAQTNPAKAAQLARETQEIASLSKSAVAVTDTRALRQYREQVDDKAKGVSDVREELAKGGKSFLDMYEDKLREAICTEAGNCKEEIGSLMEDTKSLLKLLIPLVVSTLNLPVILGSIGVTVTVILLKTGLDTWCAMGAE